VETLVSGNLVHEFDTNGFPKDKTVSKMVVELIGLGYDQFCKACILAQNSFSNFLKANDFEKADILEKITGTSIYGRIADVIAKGYDDAYKEKKAIDDAISGQARIMLSDVDLAKFKAEKEELLQEQEQLKRSISSMVAGISWWNDLETLKEKRETAETNKRTAEEKEKELLHDRKRLERHDKVEKGLGLLDKEARANNDLKNAAQGVVDAQEKLKENQDDIKTKEIKKAEAENVLREQQIELDRLASVNPIKENFSLIESERILSRTYINIVIVKENCFKTDALVTDGFFVSCFLFFVDSTNS
jgi:DNA repair exonuclease SbcCD ATPase subunit